MGLKDAWNKQTGIGLFQDNEKSFEFLHSFTHSRQPRLVQFRRCSQAIGFSVAQIEHESVAYTPENSHGSDNLTVGCRFFCPLTRKERSHEQT